MSSRDAAMYTVLAIRRRLTSAVKDPACACSSCNMTADEKAVEQIYIDEARDIEFHRLPVSMMVQSHLATSGHLHFFGS